MSLFGKSSTLAGFARVPDTVLNSKYLRSMLLPEGLSSSPYEDLVYEATLVLRDERGAKATFQRRQQIRFLQAGVSALLDQVWGDGILVSNYHHSAGALGESFKEQGRRHFVIELKRPMARGESLDFVVKRDVMEMFLDDDGWVETTLNHPARYFRRRVVFPKGRPVREASLKIGSSPFALPIRHRADGRTFLDVVIESPKLDVSYRVCWDW